MRSHGSAEPSQPCHEVIRFLSSGPSPPPGRLGMVNPRSVRSAALFGLLAGLATVAVAEAVRPRGGSGLLLDWEDVRRRARSWLASSSAPAVDLASAERQYRLIAPQLPAPLL